MSFEEFLQQQQADSATIQEAAILYLGEVTDDLPPEEMRDQIVEAAGDQARVDAALEEVRRDSALTEKILLAMFAAKWQEPGEAERIQRAFASARRKLPVIESIIIGSITLYAMYLTAHFLHIAATGDKIPPPAPPNTAVGSLFSLFKRDSSKEDE